MLTKLKERFLGDDRTVGVVTDMKLLYEAADDKEAFHAALQDGDIETAATYHPLSAEELHAKIDGMLSAGTNLAEDYEQITEADKQAFIDA